MAKDFLRGLNSVNLACLSLMILPLAACQSFDGSHGTELNQECVQKKLGTKLLSKLVGKGLGLAGVPGGGLVGRGVEMAVKPECDLYKPDADQRTSPQSKPGNHSLEPRT